MPVVVSVVVVSLLWSFIYDEKQGILSVLSFGTLPRVD